MRNWPVIKFGKETFEIVPREFPLKGLCCHFVSSLEREDLGLKFIGFAFVVRNQLQNAADAAVLDGVQGLLADPGNCGDSGQAKQLAIQIAGENHAAGQPIILTPGEIGFPRGNLVKGDMTRPAPTFFAKVLGVSQFNIRMISVAVAAPIVGVSGGSGGNGMRPWTVIDQFGHGGQCVPPILSEPKPRQA